MPLAVSPGTLVAISCADPTRLCVLLVAAERSMREPARPQFMQPLVSSPLPNGAGSVVSANHLQHLAASAGLLVTWTEGGRRCGYDHSPIERVASGIDLVIGIPAGMEAMVRRAWPATRFVRISAGTDLLRQRLTPRSTFARSVFSMSADEEKAAGHDTRLTDAGDIATTIRNLAAAISKALPERLAAAHAPEPRLPRSPKTALRKHAPKGLALIPTAGRPVGLNTLDPTR